MKRNYFIALSVLVCMSALLALTSCGKDDEPGTMKQVYTVSGSYTYQDGTFVGGYSGGNDDTREFKFYESIYKEVNEIIKTQVWDVTFKADEKDQKLKEQNALAEQRYSAMVKALNAVQKKLDAADKNTYKCHFSMIISVKAVGEKEICSGQITLKYVGNE